MALVRIMQIDDVETDEDLKRWYAQNRKAMNYFVREFASAAPQLAAMLKPHDERAGLKRRSKVVRPIALAAAVMILIAKYLTLSARRFETEYSTELRASRRRSPQPRRSMKFGG